MSIIKNHNKIKLASDKNQNKTIEPKFYQKRYEICPQCDWLTSQKRAKGAK